MLWDLWGCGTEQHLFYLCIFIINCIVLVVFFSSLILWSCGSLICIYTFYFKRYFVYLFHSNIFFLYGLLKCLVLQVSHFKFPTFFPLPFCFVGKLHNHSIIFVPWLPDDIPNVDGGILSYKVFVILVHVIIYWYECNVICIFIFVFSLV